MLTVKSLGISSIGMDSDGRTNYWHIFATGCNNVKVYFTEDGTWTEDAKLKAESDSFMFVYEALSELLNDQKVYDDLESSLLF